MVDRLPVHPRVHGELQHSGTGIADTAGSSPRTRGTPRPIRASAAVRRFIPAYTGNSRDNRVSRAPGSVHPRVHGELAVAVGEERPAPGSSPRTRGTLAGGDRRTARGRFIPAYTGNSPAPHIRPSRFSVHPRVHGELQWCGSPSPRSAGSSPRTRGTPTAPPNIRRIPRFIPAYTGNSLRVPTGADLPAVHPRVHGELSETASPTICPIGSSPRTRGTLHPRPRRIGRGRFIPAYTGNSLVLIICPVEHQFRPAGDALRSNGPARTVPVGFA